MKIKRIQEWGSVLLAAVCLSMAGASFVKAYYSDVQVEAGALHMLASGVRTVQLLTQVATDNSLYIKSEVNNGTAVIVSTNGFVSFHTAAGCDTETPGRAGELCYASSAKNLCISTGTNIGSFVIISSMTGAGNTVVHCQ